MRKFSYSRPASVLLAGACALSAMAAWAQKPASAPSAAPAAQAASVVQVRDAWVRATLAGQKATGAFMELHTQRSDLQLVGARSPLTPVVQVHEMSMQDGVMRMREVPALPLAAGKATRLSPSGFHVMLMDLPAPVAAGSEVPITLVFKDGKGRTLEQTVHAKARAPGRPAAAASGHGMHAGHGTMP